MSAPTVEHWTATVAAARTHLSNTLSLIQPPIPSSPSSIPNPLPRNTTPLPATILTPAEIQITESLSEQLLAKLASREVSAVEVVGAFIRRAGVASHLVNCITEVLPQRALARAAYLDAHLAKTGRTVGVLHGLPLSVKEHIGLAGLGLNGSFVSLWGCTAERDAACVRILEEAGAVVFARTTQPQTVMHLETESVLYGVTVNPYSSVLTAGGSSGGEGALMGLRGGCFGVGSDIGGSVRSPAANCGVYGLKPTSGRVPVNGWLSGFAGTDNILPVIGPLSTSIHGIKLFMQVLIDAKPWLVEPSLIPIPWRRDLIDYPWIKKLKIGVLWDDEVVRPHPPVTRALKEVVDKLKNVPGIEIIEWKPYEQEKAWSIAASLYFIDGGKQEKDLIEASGEPWLPLSRHVIHENEYCKRLSIEELWQWQNKREVYREEYAKLWNDTAPDPNNDNMMDAILCPVGPGAAPVLGTAKWWGYTSQWNVLDYPAIVFPVTKCDAELDFVDEQYQPRNGKDESNWKTYNPEIYNGVPVSLQLVCRRYEDEKLIGILQQVQDSIGLPFVPFP